MTIALIPMIIIAAVVFALPIIIGVYVYRDADRRGMNAILWALVAALAPSLIGFIIYLLVRGSYSNLRCPSCDAPVKDLFVVCPKCGTKLKPSCPTCSAAVEPDWKMCPKCASPLPEAQTDVHAPIVAKDKSIWKVLVILIIIPVLVIGILVASLSVYSSGGSASFRETSLEAYQEEMYSDAAYQNVLTWMKGLDKTPNHAYALQYDHANGNTIEHLFLVYVPGAGNQLSPGIGQSRSIFGSTLSLDIHELGNEGCLFNIISSAEKAPKLKITLGGETIPCDVTVVDYNPTVFALVPLDDIPEPVSTGDPIEP